MGIDESSKTYSHRGELKMKLYDKLVNKQESIALVGLGYVGMPIAHAFAKKGLNVIGFDLNAAKIELSLSIQSNNSH